MVLLVFRLGFEIYLDDLFIAIFGFDQFRVEGPGPPMGARRDEGKGTSHRLHFDGVCPLRRLVIT